MGHASPDPGAVVKRGALAGGAVNLSHAIDAGGGAWCTHEITVQRAPHVPRVILCRKRKQVVYIHFLDVRLKNVYIWQAG